MRLKKVFTLALGVMVGAVFTFGSVLSVSAADQIEHSAATVTQTANLTTENNLQKNKALPMSSSYTIKDGQTVTLWAASPAKRTATFRYKAPRSGALAVSATGNSHVRLYTKSGKAISNSLYVNAGSSSSTLKQIYFGVARGKTYKIKLSSTLQYSREGVYTTTFYVKSKAFKGKYGKSSKKAAKLSGNNFRRGYIAAGSKAKKYYKYSKRAKRIRVYFKGAVDNKLTASVKVSAAGTRGKKTSISVTRMKSGQGIDFYTMNGKTVNYRILIAVGKSGKSSGAYAVKCKKIK
ncbi:MAG: hypothetical protein ACOX41_08785 [Anaerovoracaceae bacterium]|jgi:hypothetical protein